MTVRFITPWNGYQPGDRANLSNEATLIAGGLARPDYVQDEPVSELPVMSRRGPGGGVTFAPEVEDRIVEIAAGGAAGPTEVDALLSYASPLQESALVRLKTEGFAYRVAPAGATDHDVVTAAGSKLYAMPSESGTLSLLQFGARGDGVTDDRGAILAAIDAAYRLAGATIVGAPGKVFAYSGRIKLRPGVKMDLGTGALTPAAIADKSGCRLVALDSDGGIDLVAGASLTASLRAAQASVYTGPMLDINDTKSTELAFGRNERECYFDVDMRGNRQAGSVGLRLLSAGAGGVSWVRGRAVVGEMDYSADFVTSGTGYVNENWIDIVSYGAVESLRGINGGNEISSNQLRLTVQTDSLARAMRAFTWGGVDNTIHMKVWDWTTGRVNPASGGTVGVLTEISGGNVIHGHVPRGSATGFRKNPIVDLCATAANKNIVNVRSGRFQESVDLVKQAPASVFRSSFVGDQDDSFAYATRRYSVTATGTTPPDATGLARLFDLTAATCSVAPCSDYQVVVDLGVTPGNVSGMGVIFPNAQRPDTIRIEGSTNNSTWVSLLEAGFDGDIVPPHVFRSDGLGNYRYYRLSIGVTGAPRQVQIARWWCVDLGFSRLHGPFAHIHDPKFSGSVEVLSSSGGAGFRVAGNRVVGARGAAIADATAGTEVATINAVLAAMRTHGLIAT